MAAMAEPVFFAARRGFHETDGEAVLTIFAKGVPDAGHVRTWLADDGRTLHCEIAAPGRGLCRFTAGLTAAVTGPIAVVISPSKIKVELKMTKAAKGLWSTLGRLAMQEATAQEAAPQPATGSPATAAAAASGQARAAALRATKPPHSAVRFPLVGLQNTGNTCFLNSVLQAVSAVEGLGLYFRTGTYVRDVNEDNALGMQGRLAHGYAKLVAHLLRRTSVQGEPGGDRASRAGSVSPRDLKDLMGLYQKRFDGSSQQDASEFFVFLLDGLHEDLNRVRVKPEYQELSSDDDEDEDPGQALAKIEVFRRWWHSRTNSAVSDLFQGIMQVERRCVECGRVRKSFDAFWNIQCELPTTTVHVGIPVVLSFADRIRQPLALGVVAVPTETIETIATKIASVAGVKGEKICLAEAAGGRIRRVFSRTGTAKRWKHDGVVMAYEMSSNGGGGGGGESSNRTTTWVRLTHLPPTQRELLDSEIDVSGIDLDQCSRLKELGNDFYKKAEHVLAADAYSRAIAALGQLGVSTEVQDIMVTCLLNRSSCGLKLGKQNDVISDCTEVLRRIASMEDMGGDAMDAMDEKLKKNRMKAFFKRGAALAEMKCSQAKADLLAAAKLGPTDKQVRAAYAEVKKTCQLWKPLDPGFVHPGFVSIPASGVTAREIYESVSSAFGFDQDDADDIILSVLHEDDDSTPIHHRDTPRLFLPRPGSGNGNETFNTGMVVSLGPDSTVCIHWGGSAWRKRHGSTVDVSGLFTGLEWSLSRLEKLPVAVHVVGDGGQAIEDGEGRRWCPVQEPASVEAARSCQNKVPSIYDCMRLHTSKEHLSGAEQAYCGRCKKHQDSVREHRVAIAPKILTLTFKRFSHDGHNADMMQRLFGGRKIDFPIVFPIDGFDMSEFMAVGSIDLGIPKYQLVAIINHFGMVVGGHYTAVARHGEQWYNFDDDTVTAVDTGAICPAAGNTAGYMLVFRQNN